MTAQVHALRIKESNAMREDGTSLLIKFNDTSIILLEEALYPPPSLPCLVSGPPGIDHSGAASEKHSRELPKGPQCAVDLSRSSWPAILKPLGKNLSPLSMVIRSAGDPRGTGRPGRLYMKRVEQLRVVFRGDLPPCRKSGTGV